MTAHTGPIGLTIANPQPPPTITFHSGVEEVGRLWVDENGKFHFEGNMDESASAFLELVGELWESYLKNKA